jgi:hypothetical protein
MIEKLKLRFDIVNNGLFHDSRADVIALMRTVKELHEKINELVETVNKIEDAHKCIAQAGQ